LTFVALEAQSRALGKTTLRFLTLEIACDSLRRNRLRVFLATIGVTIGSACIILVVTVSLTARSYVMNQIEALGSNLIYANYVYNPNRPSSLDDDINLSDLQAVKAEIPEVSEVAGTRQMPVTLEIEGNQIPANVVGVTERFQAIRKLTILRGRYFEADDARSHARVCLVSAGLAQRGWSGASPVGEHIRLGELQFQIIGVFTQRVSSIGTNEIQRESVLVPFNQITYLSGEDHVWLMYAQARTPAEVPVVTRSVYQLLKSRHPGPAAYRVQNLDAVLQVADHVAFALKSVMLLIALIAMVSSGTGIMNIMLASVMERTQEIGIRRAVGARPCHILFQFLLEAVMISLAGGIAGVALGLTIPTFIKPMLQDTVTVQFSWLSPFLALLVSCLFGLSFGFLPARRAARLDPAESLRYE